MLDIASLRPPSPSSVLERLLEVQLPVVDGEGEIRILSLPDAVTAAICGRLGWSEIAVAGSSFGIGFDPDRREVMFAAEHPRLCVLAAERVADGLSWARMLAQHPQARVTKVPLPYHGRYADAVAIPFAEFLPSPSGSVSHLMGATS